MSPYIFILCMDLISNYISHLVDNLHWNPVILGRNGLSLSHLFFADDLNLVYKSNAASIQNIHNCITRFNILSGQRINASKSKAIFSPVCPQNVRFLIKDLFNISTAQEFGKYLGFPILN